jgi:hypothetical protein
MGLRTHAHQTLEARMRHTQPKNARDHRHKISEDKLKDQIGRGYLGVAPGEWNELIEDYVDDVIAQSDSLVVYMDIDHMPEHAENWDEDEYPAEYALVKNRIQMLVSLPSDAFTEEQLLRFRVSLGQALARLLDDKDANAAGQMLDYAESFFNRCSAEQARIWQLTAAFVPTAALLLFMLGVGLESGSVDKALVKGVSVIFLGTCAGGVGAFASLVLRLGNLSLDHTSGRRLHRVEAALRILIGAFSGTVVALTIQAGILAFPNTDPAKAAAFLVLSCAVAGTSERVLTNLVAQTDSITGRLNLNPFTYFTRKRDHPLETHQGRVPERKLHTGSINTDPQQDGEPEPTLARPMATNDGPN